ncbi:plasmid mobilization protein, partial [Crocosphaera watsonii]|uniref:plasmid mobilization protein n=1 Tax=Crocosphaera watsonii TaxID=263511 RepID=UPI0006525314
MRRYNDRLEIRLSTEQKEQLSQIAGKQTISELIRKTLLFEPTRSEKKINREISNELKRMGNNLNQIAKVLNSTPLYQIPIPATEIIELKEDIDIVRKELIILEEKLSA